MKPKYDFWDWLAWALIVLTVITNFVLAIALHQSHANERSLSARVDALMKMKHFGVAHVGTLILTNEATPTYTVTIRDTWDKDQILWSTTNAIEVTNHEATCWLVRYLEHGRTNEFHAWAVPITIETNKPKEKASSP